MNASIKRTGYNSSALVIQVGDGPSLPTGLGRVGRGLARVWQDTIEADPPFGDFLQIGLGEPAGYRAHPWTVLPAQDQTEWCAGTLWRVLEGAAKRGIEKVGVFTVWDPARCYEIQQCVARANETLALDVKLWGYFAVDAEGPREDGGFGGPAAFAVQHYDRVIPYTRFGEKVLRASIGKDASRVMAPLPHWLEAEWFGPLPTFSPVELLEQVHRLEEWTQVGGMTIGCVATNQLRKNYGLFFEAVKELRKTTPKIKVWIHTDFQITPSWSIPELAECFVPGVPILITGALHNYMEKGAPPEVSDETLRWLYSQCDVTVAPGLGEGWGYPLIESLACGVPVVHGDYAGGAEILQEATGQPLVASIEMGALIVPKFFYRDGPYALARPVFDPREWGAFTVRCGKIGSTEAACLAASHFSAARVVPLWRERLSLLIDELLEA